jgi:hypothetical protein
MYLTMDGFDLGVGILFPFAPGDTERDLTMASIATKPGSCLAAPCSSPPSRVIRHLAAGFLRATHWPAFRPHLPRNRVRVPLSGEAVSAPWDWAFGCALFLLALLGLGISLWPNVVAVHRDALANSILRAGSGIRRHRGRRYAGDHPRLSRLCALGFSRQNQRQHRLWESTVHQTQLNNA